MPRANPHITIDFVQPSQDLPKIFQRYKIGTGKPSFGGGVKRKPYLTDGSKGLDLSFPPKMDAFLATIAPLTLSDVSVGKYD